MKIAHLSAAATLALLSVSAQAVTITSLFNTGVDATATSTTGNGTDQHWTFNAAPAFSGGTNGSFPIGPWMAESAISRWATPTSNASDSVISGAYSTVFTLGSFTSASFSGRFAADDSVTSITLNGNTISGSGGGFTFWTPFSTLTGFQVGANTLTFNVLNSGGGPSGLRVEVIESNVTSVPEPASWALLIVGFGMVGVAARRRKAVVAG